MGVSRTPTNRLLNAWQSRMMNPYHFNQLAGANAYAPLSDPGQLVYVQRDRDMIAEACAIASAEIRGHLGTYHRPTFTEEVIHISRNWRPDGNVFLENRWVQAIGSRGTTLIEADVAVTYDLNAGTATVQVTTAVDAGEVQVFFRVADGADAAAAELWEIEPLRSSASGGVVTLTGHAALFADPSLWAAPYTGPNYNQTSKNVGDSALSASYVTAVDVYRVYVDTTDAVTFQTDPRWLGDPDSTVYDSQAGVGLVSYGKSGAVTLRPAYSCNWRLFNRVTVKYQAGFPLNAATGQPDAALETAFIRLANCRIPQYAGGLSDQRTQVWQEDQMVDTFGGANSRPLNAETPFGYRRGEIAAYRTVTRPPYYMPVGGVMRGM